MGTSTEQQQKVSVLFKKAPLIISGPCSAETEEQVMATAHGLAAIGKVDIMRAGIWKPRTRPGSFEGIGTKGLPWLQQAKRKQAYLLRSKWLLLNKWRMLYILMWMFCGLVPVQL